MKDLVYPRERVLGAITLVLGLSGWLLTSLACRWHSISRRSWQWWPWPLQSLRPGVSLHSLGTDRASERQRH